MKTKFWVGETGNTLPEDLEDFPKHLGELRRLVPLAGELMARIPASISEKQYSSIRMEVELNDSKRISCLVMNRYLCEAYFAMAEKLADRGITIDDISTGKISIREYSPRGNRALFTCVDEPIWNTKEGQRGK